MNRLNYRKTPIGFDEQTTFSGYTRAENKPEYKIKKWVLKCYNKQNSIIDKQESISYSLLKEIGGIHDRKSPDNWHSLREI
jgi:hypothetical protein